MIGDEYLKSAIELAFQTKSLQDSAEQDKLAKEQQLKRDSMLEKSARIARDIVSGKGDFAKRNTFLDICDQNDFDPNEIIDLVAEEYQDLGVDKFLGGL